MTKNMLVAIPVYRIGCKVEIDRGRVWSVIDEGILWSITRSAKSISTLSAEADLPHQVIVASVARLMRFRLVEVTLDANAIAFRASPYGIKAVSSGAQLPTFPKRIPKHVSFVIERAGGGFFPTRHIRLMSRGRLNSAKSNGIDVRIISVEGGEPPMSNAANISRLSEIAARGWDEQVALVDGKSSTLRDDEFMVVNITDGVPRGLPDSTSPELRQIVMHVATLPSGMPKVPITYAGPHETEDSEPKSYPCSFDLEDLIIGGSAQRICLESLLSKAHRRVVIHSTFLDAKRFAEMRECVRAACLRGVSFDLLWGAEKDEETEQRNATAASAIATIVREDKDMRTRVRVHLKTTGSHAKLILLDTADEGWIAGVGSCNWLSSPFQAVELSVILRDQSIVADIAHSLQQLAGRRGLYDDIATEMAMIARDLRNYPSIGGPDRISLIVGDAHDRLIRTASNDVTQRFVVSSNRLGSTARPGALMQGEVAASKPGVQASVIYTQTTGPLKNRHAKQLAQDASQNGVRLIKTKKIPLHGKFLAWDTDDLVVTSLNWASASANPDFPWGEIGVHIQSSGIATEALERLENIFPEIASDSSPAENV